MFRADLLRHTTPYHHGVVVLLLLASALSLPIAVSAATIEVTKYYAANPGNGKYDRNPSLVMFGDSLWLFYTKGDDGSTGGVRGPLYNPDNDSYVIWYKYGLSEADPMGGPETRLDLSATNRPEGFDQRDVSAVSFNGSLYVFASAGFGGSQQPVYYYTYDGSWSGPVALPTGGGGHVNAVCDADRVYLTLEQGVDETLKSVLFTWDGTTLSGPFTVVDGNGVPKVAEKDDTLFVISVTPGSSTVNLHSCPAGATPSTWTQISDPISVPGSMIWDPSLCVEGSTLNAFAAPSTAVPDRQWIVQSRSTNNGLTWSPTRTITTGGCSKTDWWEYWPVAYNFGEEGYILLFTTEGNNGAYGDGMIAGIATDWLLTHDHAAYIQPAIDMAVDGDSVLLGEGIYTGDGNRDLSFGGKGIVLTKVSPWATTIIDCEADSLDAHRAFTFEDDEDSTSVLSNVVIRNAYAPLDTFETPLGSMIGRFGGGVLLLGGSAPRFENLRFEKCYADAGAGLLAVESPALRIFGSTFLANQAGSGAAALVVWSRADFADCEFDSNLALADGAAALQFSMSTGSTTSCNFESNITVQGQGGALVISDTSDVRIDSCHFAANEVLMTEGDGAAIHLRWYANCQITASSFQENSAADNGGAIAAEQGCTLTVANSAFYDNDCGGNGGAIAIADSTTLLLDFCTFDYDSASQGAALEIGLGGEHGGGGCKADITNCTFAFNGCFTSGGAISIQAYQDSIQFENCLIAHNSDCSAFAHGTVPALTCSDLYGNENGDWTGILADQLFQRGNIWADPLFCRANFQDLHISAYSPCAAAHSECRRLIGAVGVGCPSLLCGDADGTGMISISDAVYLITYIFSGGPAPDPQSVGDADCSGAVSISDVVYLINYIFAGGPAPCATCP